MGTDPYVEAPVRCCKSGSRRVIFVRVGDQLMGNFPHLEPPVMRQHVLADPDRDQ